jgi:hypothetical protein
MLNETEGVDMARGGISIRARPCELHPERNTCESISVSVLLARSGTAAGLQPMGLLKPWMF